MGEVDGCVEDVEGLLDLVPIELLARYEHLGIISVWMGIKVVQIDLVPGVEGARENRNCCFNMLGLGSTMATLL